jgi:hypothetical protein
MKVKELISALSSIDPESRVFMGYDGDVVVTGAYAVEYMSTEQQIGNCWWSVKVGDTVILCDEA